MQLKALFASLLLIPSVLAAEKTFRLRPDPDNAEVRDLGFVSNGMGWMQVPSPGDFRGYLDPVHRTVNSTGTGILYLRPTQGIPNYWVQNGDPFSGPDNKGAIFQPWSIITNTKFDTGKPVTRDWLDGNWLACSFDDKQYKLYSGSAAGSNKCSGVFMMEVVYDGAAEEGKTVTASSSGTETGGVMPGFTGEPMPMPSMGNYSNSTTDTETSTTKKATGTTRALEGDVTETGGSKSETAKTGYSGMFVAVGVAAAFWML